MKELKAMEEKREKAETNPMANSVAAAFSDEIPNMTMMMSGINNNSNNTFITFPFSSTTNTNTNTNTNTIFDIDMMPPSSSSSSSFGATSFLDLLSVHDYNNPFLFDYCLPSTITNTATTATQIDHHPLPSPADGSEVLNTPASPNSTSISSSSHEATTTNNISEHVSCHKAGKNEHKREHEEAEDEVGDGGRRDDQDQQDKSKKQLKPKKKNQKKQREPRFAFMTKSEVDQLDDGYRWRKYGQKAVKNSPYPRSYYRCTTAGCGVKKRVERSSEDPTIVVTTYEGQHIHPCPATSRATLGFMQYGNGGAFGSRQFMLPHLHQQTLPLSYDSSPSQPLNSTAGDFVNSTSSFSGFFQDQENHHHQGFVPPCRTTSSLLRDNGLLQDIVMRKEKRKEEEEDE